MSSLKHTIRHQQAQLQTLETLLQRAPRVPPALNLNNYSPPASPTDFVSPMVSPPPPSPGPVGTPSKVKRRSSYDVLQNIAGPESSLPLPRRDTPSLLGQDGIPEGIPIQFGAGPSNVPSRRTSSPTRTLSRIPIASVGNARALADEGRAPAPRSSHVPSVIGQGSALDLASPASVSSPALVSATGTLQPPSPNTASHRVSLTPKATTKMLVDLQSRAAEYGTALENTKAQLRLSQRNVAQLTRQTEDLKEVRERLRLENESLNNVVARKERLLQEVLDRARKAEAEAAALKTQLKSDTAITKKSLREMEAALSESTALSSKSEREYITLRDSLKEMKESWRADTEGLREEMRKREERWRKEAEETARKYKRMLEEAKARRGDVQSVEQLRGRQEVVRKEIEDEFKAEIADLRTKMDKSAQEHDQACATAENLAQELARLRRLMQRAGRSPTRSPPPDSPT
ncbi:hypothetical protein DENSPDRAFT_849378 [Dentipellis sp. KUC8613]|nr:hypothetical protein DENSPDRAFT_849378 [Dentipellis sp. KUC8613]